MDGLRGFLIGSMRKTAAIESRSRGTDKLGFQARARASIGLIYNKRASLPVETAARPSYHLQRVAALVSYLNVRISVLLLQGRIRRFSHDELEFNNVFAA